MKKYRVSVKDPVQSGIDFGVAEDMVTEVTVEICEKTRESIEDSVLDALHLEAVFRIPYEDMKICEFDSDFLNTIEVEEAIMQCPLVTVKMDYLDDSMQPWCRFTNPDTGEIVAHKLHFNNFQGIAFGGKIVGKNTFSLFLNSLKKYDGKERRFGDFFA